MGNEKFRTSWNTGEKNNTRYYIKRDYGNKYRIAIDENGQEHSYELKKGINFRSLIQFKGVHPMLETLRDSILEYSKAHPGEIYAGNTLVNGYELMPCDPDFLKYYSIDSSKEEAYLHAAFKSEEKREKKRNYKHTHKH